MHDKQSANSHLESYILNVEKFRHDGNKKIGVLLYLQMQLNSKYIYKCPRELSCTVMWPWTVQLLTFECMSLQFTCSECSYSFDHASWISILRKGWDHYIHSSVCYQWYAVLKPNMMAQSNNQEPFCKQSSSKMMVKISWPQLSIAMAMSSWRWLIMFLQMDLWSL